MHTHIESGTFEKLPARSVQYVRRVWWTMHDLDECQSAPNAALTEYLFCLYCVLPLSVRFAIGDFNVHQF